MIHSPITTSSYTSSTAGVVVVPSSRRKCLLRLHLVFLFLLLLVLASSSTTTTTSSSSATHHIFAATDVSAASAAEYLGDDNNNDCSVDDDADTTTTTTTTTTTCIDHQSSNNSNNRSCIDHHHQDQDHQDHQDRHHQQQQQQQQRQSCKMKILNQSGASINLYWIHPTTGDAFNMNQRGMRTAANGDLMTIDVTHPQHDIFEARILLEEEGEEEARSIRFQTPNHDETPFLTITPQMKVIWNEHDIAITKTTSNNQGDNRDGQQQENQLTQQIRQLIDKCQQQQQSSSTSTTATSTTLIKIKECVEETMGVWIQRAQKVLDYEKSLRERIGATLEEYSCNDDSLNTTKPIRIEQWIDPSQKPQQTLQTLNSSHEVWILLDRKASKIHAIQNFISNEECNAMQEAAAATELWEGMVADGMGGVVANNKHRKAKQAWITVPAEGPISQLSQRIFHYVNHVLPTLGNITQHGQEDIMSIQYKGKRGDDNSSDEPPDQYKPHCDGLCDGLPYRKGNRMATMVMYCTLPQRGGHTNFQFADVHIKPVRGQAIFFSYMDPLSQIMDDGFTTHSGCPVWEGHKKIVTQWIRYGVTTKHPHSEFPHIF